MSQQDSGPDRPLQSLIDEAPITSIQVRAVVLCVLVFVAEGIDLNLVPLLAPAIAESWSLPTSAFSAIFASGPVGLILGGVSVGYFADRFGRRWALSGAMILMTLSTVATAFVSSVPQLLVCRILTGIGFGGVIPAATSLVSELMPTRTRASVVAFVILGQSFGSLLMALLMKIPFVSDVAWQTTILEVGALCAVTTLVILAFLPESPRYLLLREPTGDRLKEMLRALRISRMPAAPTTPSQAQHRRNQLRALFADGRAAGTSLLWITFIGVCAVVSFFTSWITLILTEAGKSQALAVSANAAYYFGGVVGGLLLPLFCARFNAVSVLMAVILVGAASSAGLGLALFTSDPVNLAMAFVCGVFIPGAFYLLYPPAVRFYPTAIRSTGIGAAVAFGRIGNTLSPAAAGLMLSAGFTPAGVFQAMAVPMLISCLALALFRKLTGDAEAADAIPVSEPS